jgi:two-component system, LytTR family, response regulator
VKLKALIVDDVELARERVKMLLEGEEIEIIGESASGLDAVEAILNLKPDLVFLDIQMPEMDGFEIVEEVGVDQMPTTIFITAYDKFAVRAFETNAVDYLLKPFDKERLMRAVDRAKKEIERQMPDDFKKRLEVLLEDVRPRPRYLKRIPIKSPKGTFLVPVDDVDWMGASGHFVELHMKNKITHLIRRQIRQLEQKLDPEHFVRVHRSNIVNVNRIKSMHPLFNGDHLIILHDGTEINMSRTYHERLLKVFE